MKIVIFGANGRTGTLLTDQALAKGHNVTAYLRRKGSLDRQHPNLKIVTGNLQDTAAIKGAIAGSDAVYSTLGGGSLTKHAPEVTGGIDRIVSIMEEEKVNRLIYLSSIGGGESRKLLSPLVRFLIADVMIRVVLADHNINEKRIADSALQWTIVRPGSLTNGPLTGIMNHGSHDAMQKGMKRISRANVASFMLDQLTDTTYLNKGVWLYE